MKPVLKRGDTVLVTWVDHSGGTAGWQDLEDFNEVAPAYTVKTVGFIVNESKDRLVLVQNWAINDMVNHHMSIERKLIREIKLLKKAPK